MVDLILAVLREVVIHSRPDIFPVDGHVFVPVSPALFMPEANGVHELVDDGPGIDTAVAQTDLLSRPSPTNAAATTASFLNVDVTSLRITRFEPDAGLFVVLIHGLGDDASLPAVE